MAELGLPPAPPGAMKTLSDALVLLERSEEELRCPICLGTATDPVCLNPCGHVGCADCLRQALDRSNKCPLCKTSVHTSNPLVKCHAFDSLLSLLSTAKDKVEAAKLEVALRGLSSTDNGGAAPSSHLTIERVFKDSVKEAIGLANGFVMELQTERERAISEATRSHDAVVAALNAAASAAAGAGTAAATVAEKIAAAGVKRDEAIRRAKEEYERAYSALLEDSRAYLQTVAVPVALMPTTVVVHLPSLGLHFELRVRPTDTITSAVLPAVLKAAADAATGASKVDSIEYSPEARWEWADNKDASEGVVPSPSLDLSVPLFAQSAGGRPRPGSELRCVGTVKAASLRSTRCLASSWVPGSKEDFFWCKTCALKWVCSSCSDACHRSQGHDIVAFLKDHVPTFAVCYCHSKNAKSCKL